MTDDLDRAVGAYAQRAKDREAGLSQEERDRIKAEQAELLDLKEKAAKAAAFIGFVQSSVEKVNASTQGKIPRLYPVGHGASSTRGIDISQNISFGMELTSGGYDGQTLTFATNHLGGVEATMSPPPGNYTSIPLPIELGSTTDATDAWVRQMVALYLDRKA